MFKIKFTTLHFKVNQINFSHKPIECRKCITDVSDVKVRTNFKPNRKKIFCEHYGAYLKEIIGYTNKGKPINVEIACIRKMMKLANRKTSDLKYTVSLDSLMPYNEPSCEIKEEVEQDYTEYDKIVESLNLTENMRVALECRMKGLSYPEIGRVLSLAQSTAFEYFSKNEGRICSNLSIAIAVF